MSTVYVIRFLYVNKCVPFCPSLCRIFFTLSHLFLFAVFLVSSSHFSSYALLALFIRRLEFFKAVTMCQYIGKYLSMTSQA